MTATGTPTVEDLTVAARRAARSWGLDEAEPELVSLSENAVFRVTSPDGEPLILRLHRPGYNSRAEMESELAWVESLRAAGIDTPRPRRTPTGDGYAPVEVSNGDDGREVRQAGVIEWVDGIDLASVMDEPGLSPDQRKLMATEQYHRVGAILARIRRHNRTWRPPPEFTRRRWDADGLVGPDPLWGRFWEVPPDRGDRRVLEQARRSLHRRLSSLPTDRDAFGLIHADLHARNLLVDRDRLVVIDFDDAGFGWYLHDLATAIHPVTDEPWFDDARTAIVEGYRTVHPLPQAEVERLDDFLTVRTLMIVAWLDARPEVELHQYLPVLIRRAVTAARSHLDR